MPRSIRIGVLAASCQLALGGCSAPPRDGAPVATTPAPGPASAPAAPGPPGPPGSRAEGEAFQVALEPPAAAKAGEATVARVVVTARGPYHVNRDYPMAFRPDPSSRPAFSGDRMPLGAGATRTACKDFPGEDCSVSAPLGFTAAAGGETLLSGTVAFSVCNPDRCLIEKVPLSATVSAR